MVGTNQLVIMGRIKYDRLFAQPLIMLPDGVNNRRRQLIVKIVQVDHIRVEILQYPNQLILRLSGIYN